MTASPPAIKSHSDVSHTRKTCTLETSITDNPFYMTTRLWTPYLTKKVLQSKNGDRIKKRRSHHDCFFFEEFKIVSEAAFLAGEIPSGSI